MSIKISVFLSRFYIIISNLVQIYAYFIEYLQGNTSYDIIFNSDIFIDSVCLILLFFISYQQHQQQYPLYLANHIYKSLQITIETVVRFWTLECLNIAPHILRDAVCLTQGIIRVCNCYQLFILFLKCCQNVFISLILCTTFKYLCQLFYAFVRHYIQIICRFT